MGADQSKKTEQENFETVQVLETNKSIVKCKETEELFYQIHNTFSTEEQMDEYRKKILNRVTLEHQYYLSPVHNFVMGFSNLCSKHYRLVQIFPLETHTLEEEIKQRKKENRNFGDKQIWSILCSCVLSMSHFVKNQIQHYTLNPKDIVITGDGKVKVLPLELSDFAFNHIYKGCYYAPETLKCLRNGQGSHPNSKAGVFTFGMTVLSLVLNEDLSDLYHSETIQLDSKGLINKLKQVPYQNIRDILAKMLKLAPYERITFPELEQMLFGILEKDTDGLDPIQKLQESIKKVSESDLGRFHQKLDPIDKDREEQPSQCADYPVLDLQVLDEDESQLDKMKFEKNILCDRSNILESDRKEQQKTVKSVVTTRKEQKSQFVSEEYNRGRYEGYKENGMRHGFGTFYYQEGGKYCGEWIENKMEGKGALYYVNGEIAYEGEWMNDQLHGSGILYNEYPLYVTSCIDWRTLNKVEQEWTKYEGSFVRDTREGKGTLFLTNGEYYEGSFLNDLPHGFGVYHQLGGHKVKGEWKQGTFVPSIQY